MTSSQKRGQQLGFDLWWVRSTNMTPSDVIPPRFAYFMDLTLGVGTHVRNSDPLLSREPIAYPNESGGGEVW